MDKVKDTYTSVNDLLSFVKLVGYISAKPKWLSLFSSQYIKFTQSYKNNKRQWIEALNVHVLSLKLVFHQCLDTTTMLTKLTCVIIWYCIIMVGPN